MDRLPRPSPFRRGTALGIAGLAVAMAALTEPALAQGQGAAPVAVDAVVEQSLTQTVPVIGRLVAHRAGVVAARTNGAVDEVLVAVGNRVGKGQVLATLVMNRLQAEVRLRRAEIQEAEAALNTAKTRRALVEQELARLEGLRKSAAFSQARRDDKRQELASAESEIAEKEADLSRARAYQDMARIDLANATIRAPFPGVVSIRHTESGAFLGIGSPVVTLIDDSSLEIEADVPSERITGLDPGTRIRVDLGRGAEVDAVVRAVVPEENPLTRTRRVRFTPNLDGAAQNLAVNQSLTLHVPTAARDRVVTVHKDAVLNRRGQSMVFVVEDGVAQPRPVKLGEAVGNRFEVIAGLPPGTLVVVRGNERLRPGQKVRYDNAAAPAGGAGG